MREFILGGCTFLRASMDNMYMQLPLTHGALRCCFAAVDIPALMNAYHLSGL
jgi:hypothetical protein